VNQKQGLWLTVLLLVLIVAGLVLCFLQLKKFTVAQGQLQEEEDLLAQEETKLSALKLLQQRAGEWEKEQEILLLQLPFTAKEEQFLLDMQAAADLAGMDLLQVRFAERMEREEYTEMPLEMTLTGTYYQLLDFFAYLEAYERAVRIHELDLDKGSEDTELTVILNLSIFSAPE